MNAPDSLRLVEFLFSAVELRHAEPQTTEEFERDCICFSFVRLHFIQIICSARLCGSEIPKLFSCLRDFLMLSLKRFSFCIQPGDMKVVNPLFSDAESHHSDKHSDSSPLSDAASPTPPPPYSATVQDEIPPNVP